MPDLVSYAELKDYLQLPNDAQETPITALLERVEGTLEAECDREALPFLAAQSGRAEWRDGTGTKYLRLYYPIAVLTSITLGRDSSDPVDTLDVADVDVISFSVGGTRLTRTDGGKFGARGSPRYVKVTYDAAAFLPNAAKEAVMDVAAGRVRQFGTEGFKSFKLLDSGGSLRKLMDDSGAWRRAVEQYRRNVFP
ncbi:hypothetical protein LCGC14_2523360 [marine sediment metagenome]|uniref:Phage gp6-like head-tail connector protein n=1 Tax=marine sediment metagenome TaxID=412755 RepID=A0A0F9AVS0_9ZZZZ